ncbi:MAG: hypothetical protein ACLR1G_02160 [Alistipes indistinctus]
MMVLTDIRNVQRLNGWDSTQITGFEITTTDFPGSKNSPTPWTSWYSTPRPPKATRCG